MCRHYSERLDGLEIDWTLYAANKGQRESDFDHQALIVFNTNQNEVSVAYMFVFRNRNHVHHVSHTFSLHETRLWF